MHAYRSHTCADLRGKDVGNNVRLSGWVHRVRDHGGLLFIDLRDHYGLSQIVVDPDSPAFKTAETVRSEWVITIEGAVKARSEETVNANLDTGVVEVFATNIIVQSAAAELPLPVFGEQEYPEDIRLKYRFLDLRRETLHKNMMLRSKIISSMRRRMTDIDFNEFATPILTASSPEGARDFLVPSRIHPGNFFALPQAPQQYKQLIMASGFDKYFQIAPCFRDEDPRADRLPGEFYQLDMEMSFVEQEDILQVMEPVMKGIFEEFAEGKPVTDTFPRIPYDEALRKYGSDKPDLRNPIEMEGVTDHFAGSGFKIFAGMIEKDPKVEVWGIPAKTGGSRAFCDRMNSWAQQQGQPGLGYIFWRKAADPADGASETEVAAFNKLKETQVQIEKNGQKIVGTATPIVGAGPLAKNLGIERTEALRLQFKLKDKDSCFFVAGPPAKFASFAGAARDRIGSELKLIDENKFEFCWIVDFPFYEWDEDNKKVDFGHNPFSMPQGGMEAFDNAEDPLTLKAYQYDLVCNGFELASGGIRNHIPEMMIKVFGKVGLGPEVVEERFGGLYRAFQYGVPPHGGMAAGVDRVVMLLAGAKNLREVTMFPMNQQAADLLMSAPAPADNTQLVELGLRVLPQAKD